MKGFLWDFEEMAITQQMIGFLVMVLIQFYPKAVLFFFLCRWMTEENRGRGRADAGATAGVSRGAGAAGNSRTEADCQGNN